MAPVARADDVIATYAKARAYAMADASRPEFIRTLAREFVPNHGSMPRHVADPLAQAVDDALEGVALIPTHQTGPGWAPSMIRGRLGWQRWRDVDGFEPYEDKLAFHGALGPGERSEDILFAGLTFAPGAASVPAGLEQASLGALYGEVTIGFRPEVLSRATIFPQVGMWAHSNTRPATIEHLPETIVTRIAASYGFMADDTAETYRSYGMYRMADAWHADGLRRQPMLEKAMAGTREQRAAFVRRFLTGGGSDGPLEIHLRRPTGDDIAGVALAPPTFERDVAALPIDDARLATFVPNRGYPVDPDAFQFVSGVIPRAQVEAIEFAAADAGVPLRNAWLHDEANRVLEQTRRQVIMNTGGRVDSTTLLATTAGSRGDAPTAIETAAIRRGFAQRRAEIHLFPDTGGADRPIVYNGVNVSSS